MNGQNNSGVNRVFLIGRVETSPRQNSNVRGHDYLCFSLTTRENIRSSTQPAEHVELHHLVIDADHPDIKGRPLFKGDQLYIMGKTQTKAWHGTDNIRRYKTEIWISQLERL